MQRTLFVASLVLSGFAVAQVSFAAQDSDRASVVKADQTSADYQYQETRDLVQLVQDAAKLIQTKGEASFTELRQPDSRWRHDETYVFVLDLDGKMLVHLDPDMEGRNQLNLKDVDGRPIIRNLLNVATEFPDKPEGWYHYQWPVPSGLLPRWKSSYVRRVEAPSGKTYVVGSGMYNDRMEKAFVVDIVKNAVAEIQKNGEAAYQEFRDPAGPFLVKDAYVFILDSDGVEIVNPAFPNLEGRNLMELKDARGDLPVQKMFALAKSHGSGWVDYMWPKPGESVATQKSVFVSQVKLDGKWLLVCCGVYLADAPKAAAVAKKMTADELVNLVQDAAAVFEKEGKDAFPAFRKQGSKWYRDDTYFFVWTLDGTRIFHAANPAGEGDNVRGLKDVLGRPIGEMFLNVAASPTGEGWVHYMYPEPGDIFPAWKSTFVKRVKFPSGEEYLIGCGIYNMQMNESFVKELVDRAADLVAEQGQAAFPQLKDKAGPFIFMDEYVFVFDLKGVNLVNPAQPSLVGKNLLSVPDAAGKPFVREMIDAAANQGGAWVDYHWYKPGDNQPLPKHTYVRKVESKDGTFIIGAGFFLEE